LQNAVRGRYGDEMAAPQMKVEMTCVTLRAGPLGVRASWWMGRHACKNAYLIGGHESTRTEFSHGGGVRPVLL